MENKFNLKYEVTDSEIYGKDNEGYVYVDITKQDNNNVGVSVYFEVVWEEDEFNFKWEADGEPTYVDYGSQSVMYDNGSGGPESVEVYAEIFDSRFIDLEDCIDDKEDLTEEQVLQILGLSKEELDSLMEEIETGWDML